MTGRPWDSCDSATAREMRDDGATFAAIGRRLDRTYEAVRCHLLDRKGTPELTPEAVEIPDTPRHCLRCKVEFMAFGRFNRLCAVCAQVANGVLSDDGRWGGTGGWGIPEEELEPKWIAANHPLAQ